MRTIWFLIQLVLVVLAFYQPWPFFFVMCAVEGVYGLCKLVLEELQKAINPPPADAGLDAEPSAADDVADVAPPPADDVARDDGVIVGGFGWFPPARNV